MSFQHELRNHLNVIAGWARLLASAKDPSELREGLDEIENAVAHLRALVTGKPLQPGSRQSDSSATDHMSLASDPWLNALQGFRILIVDDEPDARGVLRRVLEMAGATVYEAEGADQALALLDRAHPDVVVSDLSMPGKDGLQLVRDIRRRTPEPERRVPAIALTAFSSYAEEARIAGFDRYLTKPIEAAALVHTIADATAR